MSAQSKNGGNGIDVSRETYGECKAHCTEHAVLLKQAFVAFEDANAATAAVRQESGELRALHANTRAAVAEVHRILADVICRLKRMDDKLDDVARAVGSQ